MSFQVRSRSPLFTSAIAVGVTMALCTTLLLWIFWPVADWWRIPLTYHGDGLWSLFVIKTVLQTGWYATNPMLGAPFEANFLDFAKPEVLHLAFYRLMGCFTQNIALVHNLFYFLGFHFISLSALIVLRRGFKLVWPLAVSGALLFAFLPFHFLRIEHLFLSSYWVVPIGAWMVLRVESKRPPFYESGRLRFGHPTIWLACAALASTSIYYAFFSLCLVLSAGLLKAIHSRLWKPLISAGLVCTLLGSLVLTNLAPSLWHQWKQGQNPAVAIRSPQEVEIYALRPLQMILPTAQHRSPTMAAWAQRYESSAQFVNENRAASLGLLGSAGLLLMLLMLLSGQRVARSLPSIGIAARANAVALMLSIAGGGGSLIALAIDPQFRAFNRISVFIGFFSIATLLLLLQHATRAIPERYRPWGLATLTVLLLGLGIWDQIPASVRPPLEGIQAQYTNDQAFVRRIEHTLPNGARILQLPYIPFPEAPPLHVEGLYSPLRGFLHSDHLRWSYGGMRGRQSDLWNQMLAQAPAPELVRIAAASGFNGIWLDRRALPDNGASMEDAFQAMHLGPGIQSNDQSLSFFTLEPTGTRAVPLPLPPMLLSGFYPWEGDGHHKWAWTKGSSRLLLSHPSPRKKMTRITLGLTTLVSRAVNVIIDGTTVASAQLLPGMTKELVFEHLFLTEQITAQLQTDIPAHLPGNGDQRHLAMALMSWEIVDLDIEATP